MEPDTIVAAVAQNTVWKICVTAENHRVQVADDRSCSAKHQSETDEPVARCTDTEVHHVLHEDVTGILGSREACLAQCETGLHEVDEYCTDQYPDYGGHFVFHTLSPLFNKEKGALVAGPKRLCLLCEL